MSYKIVYSKQADNDIESIYTYIAFELLSPVNAENQYKRITNAINSLENFPARNPKYSNIIWHTIELRILLVDNYIVFYSIDENKKNVLIQSIMYGGRDIHEHLFHQKKPD
ncbi:MAG: type II toxin-antitoxin system RelE/ParE family toxin [Clostridiales bacterium]|nr:type II toxin-antitoxin system RelE/ParE family toxin [Clostridiales bacterium]